MEIDEPALFSEALKSGINLFLGAGFSRLASNSMGVMPLGGEFEEELREEFKDLELPVGLDLSTISTIIKSQKRLLFREFCTRRFTVDKIDTRYSNILKSNIKNVFTTNIDNLIYRIFESSETKYIQDVFISGSGPQDLRSVNYFALHGCVLHTQRDYVFGATEIASSYGDDPQLWNYFAQMLANMPTLFWGYGLKDSGALSAIHSATRPGKIGSQNRWILLRESERVNEAYYRALDLKIIYGDTHNVLEYFGSLNEEVSVPKGSKFSPSQFPEYNLPSPTNAPVREASIFFEGADPSWHDIYQKIPAFTEHFQKINGLIAAGKDILIQGVAASGKTTLMKMLASLYRDAGEAVIFITGYMEVDKAKILKKIIGDDVVKIFWDNVFDITDSVAVIMEIPNVQLVFADRDYIYQFGFHRLDMKQMVVYDCSDLSSRDVQNIISKIPESMRNISAVRELERSSEPVSVFDVIQKVSHNSDLSARIRKIFADLAHQDPLYRELFVLISYFHNARVPASFDAVASYCGLSGISVLDVYEVLERLGAFVKEYSGAFSNNEQDFFAVRSQVFASACISYCPPLVLMKVISTVLREISIVKIPYYSVFQRGAFRNEIFVRAFPDWSEGLDLYNLMVEVALTDRPKPYIMQQCALYLAQKRRFSEAFTMIDEAVRMSNGRIQTIRHTQARIKFEANIDIEDDEDGYVKESLFNSMDELRDCRNRDTRKQRHSEYYARFALQLDDRYGSDETLDLLELSERWLSEETGRPGFSRRISRLLQHVRSRLSSARA